MFFQLIARDASPQDNRGKRIEKVTVRLYGGDFSGEIYITDLMYQRGRVASGWAGHVAELPWTEAGD
jgi:hypothetical protein